MKAILLAASLLLAGLPLSTGTAAPDNYQVAFSTYLGGTNFDSVRDVAVDHDGNIVVVGGTSSTNFPVTPGCFQSTLNTAGTDAASKSLLGDTDAYVAKFSPAGQLIWATYIGGTGYDRAYAVEIDPQNRIIVAGRAGPNFPTTPDAFQPNFINTLSTTVNPASAEYGAQNGFVACFDADGARLWASYVWYGELCRDVAVDDNGDIYLPSGWNGNVYAPDVPPSDLTGFRKQPTYPLVTGKTNTSGYDDCVLKVKADGSQILWGTWLCGTGIEGKASCVRVDASRNVYFMAFTTSTDMPFNAQDDGIHTHAVDGGKNDIWVGKVSADGNSLLYGTYIGGNDDDGLETHQLAVDDQGNAYLALGVTSTNLPTTAGVLLPTSPDAASFGRLYAAKIGPTGKLLLGTYFPGSGFESVEGVSVDANHNLYLTGATHAPDFPLAGTPVQSTLGPETSDVLGAGSGVTAAGSGYFMVLAPDFSGPVYSTFYGSGSALIHYNTDGTIKRYNAYGGFHASCLAPDGSFLAAGSWYSDGFPQVNAFQSNFRSGPVYGVNNSVAHCDAVIARFVPVTDVPDLSFFHDETSLGQGVYYLAFPSGNPFGYYSYLTDPAYIYHFDLGYEYCFLAHDGQSGVYFYDFASQGFFYASPAFPFPYMYDFSLDSVVYYYPDPGNPGHYNTNGVRYFYEFNTGQIIVK